MKRLIILLAVALVVVWALPAFAVPAEKPTGKMLYNLHILGKDQCPGDDLVGTNRHTIMVKLFYADDTYTGMSYIDMIKTNKIFLAPGEFQVLDGNACDGDGAKFQLPDPDVGDPSHQVVDPTFAYQVWVRGLGKPGPKDITDPDAVYAKITTCAVDEGADLIAGTDDDVIYCSTESITVQRTKGKPKWQDATKYLLSLCLDLVPGGTGCDTRVVIFDDMFYSYFWDYDNHGLRNCQIRFTALPE